MHWVVPAVHHIELYFFQRVFYQLWCKKERRKNGGEYVQDHEDFDFSQIEREEVPLAEFQRAMVRLLRMIKDDRKFDVEEYCFNRQGRVGWYEFSSLWRDQEICVRLSWPERVFLTLEDSSGSTLGKLWSILIFVAILVSTSSFILSTVPELQTECPLPDEPGYDASCKPEPKATFALVDFACVMLFSAEYVVRLGLSAFTRTELVDSDRNTLLAWMVTDEVVRIPSKPYRMFQWVVHWANVIDLAAIMPWYLSQALKSTGASQNVVLKIIRLARVIRAFRLGRRFEAVVIIMRSVRRSLRALYVLVLNVVLGMVIFGALMYFAEQGTWDPATRAYLRDNGGVSERSPFESVPACFWWAIVTATTVGYGDAHTPTTLNGKLVAGLTMIWSLCVLALPIGVIGGNFGAVWEEYDHMKEQEEYNRQRRLATMRKSMTWRDPLHHHRQMVLELWHDSGIEKRRPNDVSQSEFLGEVICTLDIRTDEPVTGQRMQLPFVENAAKARRKARGTLTFEYSWEPNTKLSTEAMLKGRLDVRVLHAENITAIDWKESGTTDPFVMVVAYPHSPDKDGRILPVAKRTPTVFNNTNPHWDTTISFEACWSNSACRNRLSGDMKKMSVGARRRGRLASIRLGPGPTRRASGIVSEELTADSFCLPTSLDNPVDELWRVLPKIQGEVNEVRAALQRLKSEVAGVRTTLQKVLVALQCEAPVG